MKVLQRTRAVSSKMINEINKILLVVNIIVQIIFTGVYAYNIYNSIDNLPFLIIYIIISLLSTINFVNYLITYKKSNKKINIAKRIIRIFKYILNSILIAINVYGIYKFGGSDLDKILLIVSSVSLLAQIIVEFVRIFIERYVELYSAAIALDFDLVFKIANAGGGKGAFYSILDVPLEAIANKIQGIEPEYNETEEYVNGLAEEYARKHSESHERKKNENVEDKKNDLKEHWRIIKNRIFNKN